MPYCIERKKEIMHQILLLVAILKSRSNMIKNNCTYNIHTWCLGGYYYQTKCSDSRKNHVSKVYLQLRSIIMAKNDIITCCMLGSYFNEMPKRRKKIMISEYYDIILIRYNLYLAFLHY